MHRTIKHPEIFVNEIVFNQLDEIYLLGFIYVENQFKPSRFICNRRVLYALLKQNEKTGSELIRVMQAALKHPHAVPLCIDLIDRFGTTQPLQALAIHMMVAFADNNFNDALNAQKENTLFIEQITPFPSIQNQTI